MLQCQLYL